MRKKTAGFIVLLLVGLGVPATTASPQSNPPRSDQTSQPSDAQVASEEAWQGGAVFQAFGVGMFAAAAGDLASTEWGLTRPGIYEANPLASNRAVRLSTHALVPVMVWWASNRLHKDGHDQAALWVRIAVTAAYGYAVMHNLRTAGGSRLPR